METIERLTVKLGIQLDDLLALNQDCHVEVVNGELLEGETGAGYLQTMIVQNLYNTLEPFVHQQKLGHVHVSPLIYVLNIDANGVTHSRIPDFSFLRTSDFPQDFDPVLPLPAVPTLAVEVVSPSEDADVLQAKIADYLRFGSQQVWVFYANPHQVHVYDRAHPNQIRVYHETDTLEAPTLFPGLSIAIESLFRTDEPT